MATQIPDLTLSTNPLSLLHKCKSLNQVTQIQAHFIKTQTHTPTFWVNKIINHCTLDPTPCSLNHAHLLYNQMPQPDTILFNFMARGYSRSHTPVQAVLLFVRAVSLGLVPDNYTFPSLLKACANGKALEEGKQVHCVAIKYGLSECEYIYPALINMYTACDNMGLARFVFDRIKERCVVTYNAIITGYVRNNLPNDALLMFREMQVGCVRPSDVTMLSVLSACALLGALDTGKWVHEYVEASGFDQYVKVNTALIDMYTKCGSLDDAVSVFEKMAVRDTQAWSAMIMAYAIYGLGRKAISLFEMMRKERITPDEVTILGLLYACNHSGLADECLTYFQNMKRKFGISPGIKHYGCVLDALGRAGRLEDACKFIEKVPKPTPILWRTLLSACSSHGNLELGRKALAQIFEMDQSHGGDYVIFSNMCSRAGKREEAIYTRKLMKDRGVMKVPGCSVIEIKNQVHEFFSGDCTQVGYLDLHRSVDKLFDELKLSGYKPDVSLVVHLDMKDDKKEVTLRYHSEKLAVTFGLLNSRPGETIRVKKNLRICGDCHSAFKLISLVCDRQIFVRDMNRFHHFASGKCSCGDYW
uniref:pentatricopeptide repeat-containing protein At2g02980, chloroplastic n=1 Tax=Erigeron canadensis TaxID=72917 RepID=UPI001CB89CC3|nr:pentatricopeptide repeat-containing protein At2g02980, chloroplastic [Erigeron canadensis]